MTALTAPEDGHANEQTPLLLATDAPSPASPPSADPTPLPKLTIFLLSFTRVAEPLAFAILFPFVNSMVLATGETSVEHVGYYVGIIESLFSLTQMIFLIPWGWAADHYGRKPVLLVSLIGAVVSTTLFGFSTTIWQMVAARCINGMFGGSAVVVRTLFAEFSDKSNQARAFSFFAFASNIGLFIGPVIGGALSEPERQFPNTLGRIPLLRAYPYALPCIVAGAFILTATLLDFFLLPEPAHREHAGKQPLRKVFNWTLAKVMLIFSMTMFLGVSYTAILPLFAFTPVELGGLAFRPPDIAILIAFAGLAQSIWLLVVMPPLDRAFGTRRLMRFCYLAWPWIFVMPVLANRVALTGSRAGVWAIMGGSVSIGAGIAIAFTSVQLIINNVTPAHALGAVNGFALTLNALIRAVTPAASTAVFALGVDKNILGRYLPWAVLWAFGIVGYALSELAPSDNFVPAGADEEGRRAAPAASAQQAVPAADTDA